MKVRRVLETCLYCRDLAAAKKFYGDVLGCRLSAEVADRHIFFKLDEAMLLIFNPDATMSPGSEVPPHGAYGEGHVAFAVSEREFSRWQAHLKRKNVPIEAQVTWPGGGRSLYFRDPCHNSIELTTPRTWGFADRPAPPTRSKRSADEP